MAHIHKYQLVVCLFLFSIYVVTTNFDIISTINNLHATNIDLQTHIANLERQNNIMRDDIRLEMAYLAQQMQNRVTQEEKEHITTAIPHMHSTITCLIKKTDNIKTQLQNTMSARNMSTLIF